jgi:hypothetical protein
MANTIVQSNRVAPWLGVGVQGQWDNSLDALQAAGMDFDVRQEKLYWKREEEYSDGMVVTYDETAPMFGNVRNTDDKLLGCVTPQYKIIQNRDAFALIDPFVQGNNGTITNVGMTEDGLAFMVARVQVARTIGGEPYEINLMATNSFNTKYPCQIIMVPIRIYCQNMYRKLVNDRVFLAKHTTTANERLLAIANGNAVEKKVLAFQNVIESYQGKHMSRQQLETVVAMLFPYPKEQGPRELTFRAKADEQRKMFVDRYFDAPDNRKHQDTSFGFVNAYFDYLSHRGATRETGVAWADRRLSGLVSGLDVNQGALKAVKQ